MKRLLTALILIGAINVCYSQNNCDKVPDELYRGRYKPEGMIYGNPYTMFNKRQLNWSLDLNLKAIRNKVLSQIDTAGITSGYATYYYQIFTTAAGAKPVGCGKDDGDACELPLWIRANAIIHLIGLKPDTANSKFTFTYISNPHDPWRQNFANKANEALRNLDTEIEQCYGFNDECNILKEKASHLINYLQAYDLLKAAKGKVVFDARAQSGGIYYVSLIVDGIVIKSKPVLMGR